MTVLFILHNFYFKTGKVNKLLLNIYVGLESSYKKSRKLSRPKTLLTINLVSFVFALILYQFDILHSFSTSLCQVSFLLCFLTNMFFFMMYLYNYLKHLYCGYETQINLNQYGNHFYGDSCCFQIVSNQHSI